MAHHIRIDPDYINELGQPNQDSTNISEFTFHHGHVERAINTLDDLDTIASTSIPSNVSQVILISPTFEGSVASGYLKNNIPAQPLLRGFSDSIAKGDSVIYTQIGNVFYYLGPLNTTNDPNYTPDTFYNPNLNQNKLKTDTRGVDNGGYNIDYKQKNISKVTKPRVNTLDNAYDINVAERGSQADIESSVTDLVLEGRHGNSVQVGSRFINPYITIKNNNIEGNNGSVFGMLSFGSFEQNLISLDNLSSDKVVLKSYEEGQDQYKGYLIGIGNPSISQEGIPPQNEFNINYGSVKPTPEQQTEFDQIIMFSDRITFDAQENDLTISAFRNINVGAGQNISITSKGFSLIESNNIYLGVQSQKKKEPMVLGDELRKMLEDITKILKNAHALVQGVPVPLTDALGAPLGTSKSVALESPILTLTEIVTQLESRTETEDDNGNINYGKDGPNFLSHHHYIEQNNRSNNEG